MTDPQQARALAARAARRAGRTSRAAARGAFVGRRAGDFDQVALDEAMAELLASGAAARAATAALTGFPTTNTRRWVPIGPSVVRAEKGRAWRRQTGRVRDLAVSPDGARAYAATGKGGVWFTDDGGALWAPVGGWAIREAQVGGPNNAQSCGCLLVHFGATAADDFVLVGTGEGVMMFNRVPNRPSLGGLGVLAARGAATEAGKGGDPWEKEAGRGVFEGASIFGLARDPIAVAGKATAPGQDRVVAATDRGLFLGTRGPAATPSGAEFTWVEKPALAGFLGLAAPAKPIVTDVLWLSRGPGHPDGRIVVAVARDLELPTPGVHPVAGAGVAFSDDLGAHFQWVTGLNMTTMAPPAVGRMSFANPEDTRVYVLGDLRPGAPPGNQPTVWRIPAMADPTPTATALTGVPPTLWFPVWLFFPTAKNQRDYDQAITVEVIPGAPPVDRIYLGGSFEFGAGGMTGGVWCFDVTPALALVPVTGVSRAGAPPGGDGASQDGLIGDNIHPDIHAIRLADPGPTGHRQVWVACDGGVYTSGQAGRVNTFLPRATGFASLEVNFLASHPTSSHLVAIGTQDNGRHTRVGDVVWDETVTGDAGGVAFHPNHSQFVVSQRVGGDWVCDPATGFTHPLNRSNASAGSRESDLSAFYSGAASVRRTPAAGTPFGRIALGTNRVWLTDNLGTANPNTWRVLPFPNGAVTDPRPGGTDDPSKRNVGLPAGPPLPAVPSPGTGPLGVVITQKWASATELLVLFDKGLVRWTQDPATGTWSATVLLAPVGALATPVAGAPDPNATILTDVAPVPETHDFYLTTTGDKAVPAGDTCLFFDSTAAAGAGQFLATGLRAKLVPLDPAYAAVVDPVQPTTVYVGTVTGVWQGGRTPGVATHGWTAMVNGLPQAAVQDLAIWADPSGGPRLLRAAVQARGLWEVDLTADEPQRTYVRVHLRDDRRRFPTPMANPRRKPTAPAEPAFVSPDILVRPRAGAGIAPTWQLGAGTITKTNAPVYELWTFQTAFRWHFPSVVADGQWTDALGDLVEAHRHARGLPVARQIDKALWDDVVLGTHLDPAGTATANPSDPLAVYRAPWQSATALTAVATEIDLLDCVKVTRAIGEVLQVFNEPSTIDVLVHHRDTRPLDPHDPADPQHAFVLLLWRSAGLQSTALSPPGVADLPTYVADVLKAEGVFPPAAPGALPPAPTGWNLAPTTAGRALHDLDVRLDARMPRAVPIDVDLSAPSVPGGPGIPDGHRVLFLAIVGSTVDHCGLGPGGAAPVLPPSPATPTITDLVRGWPYAAMRLVRASRRP